MSLPTTKLGGLTVTRLVMGGNPIAGFSHAGAERSKAMVDYFTAANAKALFRRIERAGINTVFMRGDRHVMRLLREYWNEGGKLQWVAQTLTEANPDQNVREIVACGASAIYVHGGIDARCEIGDFDGPRKLFERVRDTGLPAGVASHNPAHIRKIVELGWKPDFFMISLYNIAGYRGKISESRDEEFNDADRAPALALFKTIDVPCVAFKVLGAGRVEPRTSFREVCSHLKPTDLINVGMYPPDNPQIVEDDVALAEEFLPR